jgi:hypothetical protein
MSMDDMSMDDMSMGDMSMGSMYMTFQSWDTYKVTVVFDSWDIEDKWQYVLSFIAIVVAAAFYHVLRYAGDRLKRHTFTSYSKLNQSLIPSTKSQRSIFQYRLLHAVLAGFTYCYALLLMLVAMTYNPGLFLALGVGYGIGDFFALTPPTDSDNVECCAD